MYSISHIDQLNVGIENNSLLVISHILADQLAIYHYNDDSSYCLERRSWIRTVRPLCGLWSKYTRSVTVKQYWRIRITIQASQVGMMGGIQYGPKVTLLQERYILVYHIWVISLNTLLFSKRSMVIPVSSPSSLRARSARDCLRFIALSTTPSRARSLLLQPARDRRALFWNSARLIKSAGECNFGWATTRLESKVAIKTKYRPMSLAISQYWRYCLAWQKQIPQDPLHLYTHIGCFHQKQTHQSRTKLKSPTKLSPSLICSESFNPKSQAKVSHPIGLYKLHNCIVLKNTEKSWHYFRSTA